MITAVDTSVLLDVLTDDPIFGRSSRRAIEAALGNGRLIASEVVWAETGGVFPSADELRTAMGHLGVEFSPATLDSAIEAGKAWRQYRANGGKRDRVIADFLIGAHAFTEADALLTRDRGFYRAYFSAVSIVDS